MKKKWMILIMILMIGVFFSVSTKDEIKPSQKVNGVLVVGGLKDMKPYSYVDHVGRYVGHNVDVLNAIAEELGLTIIYKKVDLENAIEMLENKEIHMILGWQYDNEFLGVIRYTYPFIKNEFHLFVRYDVNNIHRLEDLQNKVVSVYRWDPSYQRIKNIQGIRIYVCDSQEDAYTLLKNGMADVYVANRRLAQDIIEEPLYKKRIKIVGNKVDALPSGIAVLKENEALAKEMNIGINIVKENKKIDWIYNKWFGEKFIQKPDVLYKIIGLFVVVGCVLLIVVYLISKINRLLRREIEQKTLEIQREDKMKTIGKITAGIAHEIRNPLTTIDAYIALLPDRIEDEEFKKQMLQDLPYEIERINNFVQNLLDYAKPNKPKCIRLKAKDEIEHVIRLSKNYMKQNNLIVDISIEERIEVLFDQYHFRQVLINLVSNALDAVKNNEEARIHISAIENGTRVELLIEDNGKGMEKEDLNDIFEPFYTNKINGNGLGLSIVAQLIKENHSKISVSSEQGMGTVFKIELPRA